MGERECVAEQSAKAPESRGSGRAAASPRVALACPGVGLVQRGFERAFHDLFHVLKDALDVTLFKGGGERNDREKVLCFASRNGPIPRFFPIHKLLGRTPIHVEDMTFALALLPHLRGGRYDVVHCVDPPLARILYKLRLALGMNFKLLYTEGCAMSPGDYPPADHMHQVAKVTFDEALEFGIPEKYMSLVPCGFHPDRFQCDRDRDDLRREHGIGPNTFVILSVAAISRRQKRLDKLVEEVSSLEGDFLLWLDGSLDQGEPALAEWAKKRLGDKCRITHIPSERVGELFRLADLLVHCSLFEAFGLALVEAASTGLPLLMHNARHFQWLIPNPNSWMDMEEKGALTKRLEQLQADRGGLAALACPDDARARFDWKNLTADYVDMYRRVAEVPMINQKGRNTATFVSAARHGREHRSVALSRVIYHRRERSDRAVRHSRI